MPEVAAAPQWAEVAKGAAAVAQTCAIVVGGIWAYFKFFRGRTFAKRLELSVAGTRLKQNEHEAILIKATMRNAGLAVVRLSDVVRVAYVYGIRASEWAPEEGINWGDHLAMADVFETHKWIEAEETVTDEVLWIEAEETVTDEVLAPIPRVGDGSDSWLVFRVVLEVGSERKRFRKTVGWTATAMVPAGLRAALSETRTAKESVE